MSRGHANIALFIPHIGCPNQCSFCDQHSISGAQQAPTPQEVAQTCQQAVSAMGKRAQQAEIAFFGGSFTAIDRAYMTALLEAASPFVAAGQVGGIRLSTRPDAIDAEVLTLLKRHGVTSIELGAQSMRDEVLALNRRGHTADQVRQAARLIRQHGFALGLQMMTGLYGDTPEGARYTAAELAALRPDQVRIYPTVVLEGTLLAKLLGSGAYVPMGLEETLPLAAELLSYFEERGISVIRLGLHASREVEARMLAGCYHPALRELCENRLFLQRILEQTQQLPKGPIAVYCNPRDRSKAAGQKRSNLQYLEHMGYPCTLYTVEDLPLGRVRVAR